MRKKKTTPNEKERLEEILRVAKEQGKIAKEQEKIIADLQSKLNGYFKPLPGAHSNNCELCKHKNKCPIANYNFSFCPKSNINKTIHPDCDFLYFTDRIYKAAMSIFIN
jgi:hypothetical protein